MSSVQQSVYMNLFILALADGRVDPAESAFLNRFAEAAGISTEQQQQWQQEVLGQQLQFVPVESGDHVDVVLALFARMVRVDGQFEAREQDAYVSMGKALGYTDEELGEVLRKYWNEDPTFDSTALFRRVDADVHHPAPSILVILDDQTDLEKLEMSANQCVIHYCSLAEAAGQSTSHTLVLFQVAEQPRQSLERMQLLKQQFPTLPVAFLARRDQAPQIGFLLEQGANKCFVKPLFPNELNKAMFAFQKKATL